MNLTEIRFDLEFGTFNGSMHADVLVDNEIRASCNCTQSVFLCVKMPSVLKIKLSGKNLNCDTLVGPDGSILSDKYIKMSNLWVSKIPVNHHVLRNSVCQFITTDGGMIFDNYWGKNGEVILEFDSADPIAWLLKKRNKFLV
jgi:hypothetical protein